MTNRDYSNPFYSKVVLQQYYNESSQVTVCVATVRERESDGSVLLYFLFMNNHNGKLVSKYSGPIPYTVRADHAITLLKGGYILTWEMEQNYNPTQSPDENIRRVFLLNDDHQIEEV